MFFDACSRIKIEQKHTSIYYFKLKWNIFYKWANPGLVLFIFVYFKQYLTKNVDFSRIQTWIVGVVEGEHADCDH